MTTNEHDHEHDENTVWVETGASDGNGFRVWLRTGDLRLPLTPVRAFEHAKAVLRVASYAEYDAAVFKQNRTVLEGIPEDERTQLAGRIVQQLRAQRLPVKASQTRPLILTPGVSLFTSEPFISVELEGDPTKNGQWDIAQARSHAQAILESVAIAELDNIYVSVLKRDVGLSEDVAMAMVAELMEFRP